MTNETTASQPKAASIGGDAHFRTLARHWFATCALPDGAKAWADLVAHIDSRATAAPQPRNLQITLRQAISLVEFFGGHDADMTITERPAEWRQPEEGLYAYCTECPEEGAQFLGATEVDDELARKGMRPAVERDIEIARAVQAACVKAEPCVEAMGDIDLRAIIAAVAAPQPVAAAQAVPEAMVSAAGRALADRSAAVCNVDKDDNWKVYCNDFIEDARVALQAAGFSIDTTREA